MNAFVPLRPADSTEPHLSCPACKDEGIPARIIAMDESTRMATVQMHNSESEVALDLLDDVQVGDFVLVHLDIAIAKLAAADVIAEQ